MWSAIDSSEYRLRTSFRISSESRLSTLRCSLVIDPAAVPRLVKTYGPWM